MTDFIGMLGRYALRKITSLGRSTIIFFNSIFGVPNLKKAFPLLVNQIYFIGVQSIIIILVSGLFIGMVLGLQGFNILKNFMATGSLGTLVSLAIIRELGPVVCRACRIGTDCGNRSVKGIRTVVCHGNDGC